MATSRQSESSRKLCGIPGSAKGLAVRKVTQDNRGKKTAGVDGLKNLSPKARLILVNSLKLGNKAAPTRRVWIPKPGKRKEFRPLSIPIISERALQTLVKLAIEPEWEARFEGNSFGFRPGRIAYDAIEAIFSTTRFKPKYVLDADIADTVLLSQLTAWAEHRHPNKSSRWSCQKYWQTIGSDNWVFTLHNRKLRLLKHRETLIVRHIKVQGNRSPFDGDWVY